MACNIVQDPIRTSTDCAAAQLPAVMSCGPFVEGIESTTASPNLSRSSTRRHMDPSTSTAFSGGSGRGADDELWGGSARALRTAWSNEGSGQLSSQAQTPLRIAAVASPGSSDDLRDGDTACSGARDLVGGHAASPQLPQQLLERSVGISQLQPSSVSLPQGGLALSGDVAEASSQSQMIEWRFNSSSSGCAPAAPGDAGCHAGQRSDASSIGSSAESIVRPGPALTATSISTDRRSLYEGWGPKPPTEPAAQYARTASAFSQGSCTSGTPPCRVLPLDYPGSTLTAVCLNGSPAVVRQHSGSTA